MITGSDKLACVSGNRDMFPATDTTGMQWCRWLTWSPLLVLPHSAWSFG